MTSHSDPKQLVVNGTTVTTMLINDYLAADPKRATSFITNFGDWQLPPDTAAAFHSPVAHLEWFHDTGELVAIGQVPHLGQGSVEISPAKGASDEISDVLPFGGTGSVVREADGSVREFFAEMVVDDTTLVAVLAIIEHGPKAHELLWGWHKEHRTAGGWAWLEERLTHLSADHEG